MECKKKSLPATMVAAWQRRQDRDAVPANADAENQALSEVCVNAGANDISVKIRELYDRSCFMANFLPFQIDTVQCGRCQISLKIEHDKYADDRNEVHGGVLAALADAILVITSASVGEIAKTVSFSIDFVNKVNFDSTVRMISEIRHHGRTTMVISGEMYDEENRMLATMQATMMNRGKIEGVPRQW